MRSCTVLAADFVFVFRGLESVWNDVLGKRCFEAWVLSHPQILSDNATAITWAVCQWCLCLLKG